MRRREALVSLAMLAAKPVLAASPFAAGEWEGWAARFIRPEGRVVDTGNGGVSHSEGQGYGMLLAHAAGDRPVLDLLWRWTERNLAVRDDGLFAWRWDPATPSKPVADRNSASDGDILVAWALARAGVDWAEPAYLERARALAVAVRRRLLLRHDAETLLLPGPEGFHPPEGPVVNLSYWVFPALRALAAIDPDPAWSALEGSGLRLLGQARFGRFALPADWTLLSDPPRPAPGFPPTFGYNAVRIPLHLVWAGIDDPWLLAPFRALWRHEGDTPPIVVDLQPPGRVQPARNRGALAIARLTLAEPGGPPPVLPALGDEADYYAASLTMLSKLALEESQRR